MADVLVADEDEPSTPELVEILNYVRAANHGFNWVGEGRPLSMALLTELQGLLMRGTPLDSESGRLRQTQVVIGRRPDAPPSVFPVLQARFVPSPPGSDLQAGLQQLVDWMRVDHRDQIDPVVAAAMRWTVRPIWTDRQSPRYHVEDGRMGPAAPRERRGPP